MTRAKISQYSATANDNTDVNGVNIAEGCPPSSMNNMGREIMAALKRFQVGSDGDGVTVGGSLVVSGSTSVNTFNVDVISEKTSAAGVTVDGVLLKDGLVGIGADGSASAPSIYRASDTNTGIFFPAADTIAFAEGGAEAMRITSSANLVLNNAAYLQIKDSGGTARDVLTIDAFNGLNINSAGGGSAAPIVFKLNGTETARLTTDNYFRLASGGIQFNGDTAAANALDDYEEGTFTPNIYNNGSSSTWTTKSGKYTKIGNTVYAWAVCDGGNSGTAGGILKIDLPFAFFGTNNFNVGSCIYNTGGSQIINGFRGASTSTEVIAKINNADGTNQLTFFGAFFIFTVS